MEYHAVNSLNSIQLNQLDESFADTVSGYVPFYAPSVNTPYAAFHFFEDAGRIISFVGLMPADTYSAEITAFTLPDFRHKGLFKMLLKNALESLSTQAVSLFSDSRLDFPYINNTYSHSEYMMRLKYSTFCQKHSDCSMSHYSVEEYIYDVSDSEEYNYVLCDGTTPLGLLKLTVSPDSSCLHHVMIRRPYRCLGHGKRLLNGALQMFYENHSCDILLHVSSTNEAAVKLYKDNYFEIIQSLDCYRIRLLSDQ